VILIPFSELNGDWTPWSGTENGNTPEESILAYRYLHERMSDLSNVSFGWAVNSTSFPNTPANAIERYYPGDAYVDYVGVDGFNMGTPWQTFGEIFDTPLTTLAQYNKPTIVFSFGSAPGPRKASWLDTALNVDLPKHPHVVAWVYFNQDKERNWLLWSDSETFEVFTDYIKDVD
jgi:beta-mannanase